MCDAQHHYTWHVYLYRGAAPRVGLEPRSRFSGHYIAFEIVQLWNDEAPLGKVLVADSYFGSCDAMLNAQQWPFLMLTATSDLVQDGNIGSNPWCVNTLVHKDDGYALSVYKTPRWNARRPK